MAFENSIFINCPFDTAYKRLLRPLIFTCIYCRLDPKISVLKDSGAIRVREIISLLKSCKYSIHDLSRNQSKVANELSRFNMPFELGLEFGLRASGQNQYAEKVCLVIDSERYKVNVALSDLAGGDISSYGKNKDNQVERIIRIVRDWLTNTRGPQQPAARFIHSEYLEFISDLEHDLERFDYGSKAISRLTTIEYIDFVKKWVYNRRPVNPLAPFEGGTS